MLASEYGWDKHEILTAIYPDDLHYLSGEIQKRQVDNWLMQLRIATNPHLESKDARPFVEGLLAQHRRIYRTVENNVLDAEALEDFKRELNQHSKTIKVR